MVSLGILEIVNGIYASPEEEDAVRFSRPPLSSFALGPPALGDIPALRQDDRKDIEEGNVAAGRDSDIRRLGQSHGSLSRCRCSGCA